MGGNQLPGYVLDVREDAKGNWSVIEANRLVIEHLARTGVGFIASVLASQETGNDRWAWMPDEPFLSRAQPLPTGAPIQ